MPEVAGSSPVGRPITQILNSFSRLVILYPFQNQEDDVNSVLVI
jgi:hypothetical protein